MRNRGVLILALSWLLGVFAVESRKAALFGNVKSKSSQHQEDEAVQRQLVNVVLESRLGKDVEFKAYDNKHYIRQNGGPIDSSADDLSCDFESPCCWANAKKTDKLQLDWNVVDQNIDPKAFERSFTTAERPSGHFLLATSPVMNSSLRAEFVSCDVLCSEKEILVSFRHWATPKVRLELCSEAAFVPQTKQPLVTECRPIQSRLSPGPTTISLPPGEYFVIKFVATNFSDTGGGLAILDDVTVSMTPCRRTPALNNTKSISNPKPSKKLLLGPLFPKKKPSAPPAPAAAVGLSTTKAPQRRVVNDTCEKLTCDFENNTLCGYVDANGRISDRPVHFLHTRIGNKTLKTEAPGKAKGKSYVGAILRPGDSIALEARNFELTHDRILRFQVFKTKANLKFCLNRVTHCPFSTDEGVAFTDGSWKAARVKLPAKTHTVYFIAENKGTEIGVVGLDDVVLVSSGSKDKC